LLKAYSKLKAQGGLLKNVIWTPVNLINEFRNAPSTFGNESPFRNQQCALQLSQ
jgi:hypothetical protein